MRYVREGNSISSAPKVIPAITMVVRAPPETRRAYPICISDRADRADPPRRLERICSGWLLVKSRLSQKRSLEGDNNGKTDNKEVLI
jgi:hypothetical protein